MSKTDAEYMRAYRARRKADEALVARAIGGLVEIGDNIGTLKARIAELEAEVKAAPVMRTASDTAAYDLGRTGAAGGFNTRPFRPTPKGK